MGHGGKLVGGVSSLEPEVSKKIPNFSVRFPHLKLNNDGNRSPPSRRTSVSNRMTDQPQSPEPEKTREFVRLLSASEQRLAAYVLAMVPNWADADDIAQQVKMRLWEQFDEYDPSKDFGAWACTIAHYLVLAHRKESQRRHARLSPQFVEAMAEEVSQVSGELEQRRRSLGECLSLLAESSRQLIALCYDGGDSIKNVALRLGRSVGGTQKKVHRIRRQLQDCIEEKMREEDQS